MRRAPAWIAVAIAAAILAGSPPTAPARAAPTPLPPPDALEPERRAENARGHGEEGVIGLFALALSDLARALLAWIGDHSDYDVRPVLRDPPRIVFAPSGGVVDFGHGTIELAPGVRGAYQPAAGVVVLALPWYLADPRDSAILLHELVHVVQLASREWQCSAETEWEAYQLQRRWLAEHDIDLIMDWLLIGMLSRCPERAIGVRPTGP